LKAIPACAPVLKLAPCKSERATSFGVANGASDLKASEESSHM